MEITKAEKYLGNMLDPCQGEVEGLQHLRVDPPKFPPAFACSIKVGEQTFYDYVLLRMHKILDDGTYIINNSEQEGYFNFEVRVNPSNTSKYDFQVNMSNATCREHLNYAKFMKALKEAKDLHIFSLEASRDICTVDISNKPISTAFPTIDDEIDFFERVCTIEEYFDVALNPPNDITHSEYDTVQDISDLVSRSEVEKEWEEITFTGVIDQRFRDAIMVIDDTPHQFTFVGVHHIELFGTSFECQIMRTYKSAYIVELEKIRRVLEILDDGDTIKMKFRPGEDKSSIESLNVPDSENFFSVHDND